MSTFARPLWMLLFLFALPVLGGDGDLESEALFGALRARQIGPALMSGRINDLELHPTDARVVYVGAAGGGVWRSRDGGASFRPIFDNHVQSIGTVAVDPVNPDQILWVGTGETWTRNSVTTGDGIFKSTDGGSTWKLMGLEKSERIGSIEINPQNNNEVYVGVLGALWSDSPDRGVYKTNDGGATWTQVLYQAPDTGCADLVMDPNNPQVLYASMWQFRRTAWSFSSGGAKSGLYKTTDGGKTWQKIHNGFPSGKLGRIGLAIAPSQTQTLYAVLETEKEQDRGLYRSDDGGANWQHLNGDFGLVVRPFYFSRLVVDPKNPDIIAKGGLNGSISRDGGKSFRNLGEMHSDIHDIVFSNDNSDRLYVATDGGLYRSWDGGNSLEIVENLPLSQFYHVSFDLAEPYNVYGGLQDNGSWYGPTASPGGIEARDWERIGFGDGFRVYPHLTKPLIYSEMQGAENVWRFNKERDEVKSIQPLPEPGDPKLRFNWNAAIAMSPNKVDRIYVGSQFLHRSDDTGDTWVKLSPDLTRNDKNKQNQSDSGGLSKDNSGAETYGTIFTIAESPLDESVIWVGTDDGNVQVTRDGGKKWTNVVANIAGLPSETWCYHIEASAHEKGRAYAVFDGHSRGDFAPYIFRTDDFGASWRAIANQSIPNFVRCLQEDTVNPDLLFAGTERGLFITIDGGLNWNAFTNNVPPVAIHAVELHPKTHDLIMATHGRGIIILDDISPLRQMTPEVLAEEVHFFKTSPAVIRSESGFGGYSTELEFVGPNPDRHVRIVYYLKKRHVFGKTELKIFNQQGDLVAELPAGKAKGINVVTWQGLLQPPKIAKGKTFAFSGFAAPRAPAGTYRVEFTKGKDVFESTIEIVNDPNSPYSDADRQALQKTTMELYRMTEDLAYLVYQIDSYSEALSGLEATKKTQKLRQELEQLKGTLVITTGDNYVGAADPQLREDLADLFGKVVQGFAPPSVPELANQNELEGRFQAAQKSFSTLQKQAIALLEKAGKMPELQPYDLFVKTKN